MVSPRPCQLPVAVSGLFYLGPSSLCPNGFIPKARPLHGVYSQASPWWAGSGPCSYEVLGLRAATGSGRQRARTGMGVVMRKPMLEGIGSNSEAIPRGRGRESLGPKYL